MGVARNHDTVTADGPRFLVNKPGLGGRDLADHLILNWAALLH
jgi:hypothetical protein